jgi:hypothetical protein
VPDIQARSLGREPNVSLLVLFHFFEPTVHTAPQHADGS